MQPEWLTRYFHQHVEGKCHGADGVSRRDFVKTGFVAGAAAGAVALGMTLEPGIPLFGARHVSLTIPGGPTDGPFGDHKLHYNDEMFSGEIGQVGSQFDGLGHIAAQVGNEIRYYNGSPGNSVAIA